MMMMKLMIAPCRHAHCYEPGDSDEWNRREALVLWGAALPSGKLEQSLMSSPSLF